MNARRYSFPTVSALRIRWAGRSENGLSWRAQACYVLLDTNRSHTASSPARLIASVAVVIKELRRDLDVLFVLTVFTQCETDMMYVQLVLLKVIGFHGRLLDWRGGGAENYKQCSPFMTPSAESFNGAFIYNQTGGMRERKND
jgi:hypothetical protein